MAKKVLLPLVHATADRILAAYLHSANGVNDGSAWGRLGLGVPGGALVGLSLFLHGDSVLPND
jgi:hypothetical protein